MTAAPLSGLLTGEPRIVTAGAALLAEALQDQAAVVEQVDWRPPRGSATALARVMADPRREAANATAVGRLLHAEAALVDVRPATEALGLEAGTFLHAGPPIAWERTSGPLRGALIGARGRHPPRAVPRPPDGRADGRCGQPVDVDGRAGGHRLRRSGLVGAGLVTPPAECFDQALKALAAAAPPL